MVRHYTHVGEAAAGAAIGLLPRVTDANESKPANQKTQMVDASRVQALANALTVETVDDVKAKLLAIVGQHPSP